MNSQQVKQINFEEEGRNRKTNEYFEAMRGRTNEECMNLMKYV